MFAPPPSLQTSPFQLSICLFAQNVNERSNNQAICLIVANLITVNDLYQPMPTFLCLITQSRGRGIGGVGWHTMVGSVKHAHESGGCTLESQAPFWMYKPNSDRPSNSGPVPGSLHVCLTSLSTARTGSVKRPDTRALTISPERGKSAAKQTRGAEGEGRYNQQLLLLRVQYIQVQSIKLQQTVTPKQTEESFSSDT